MDKKVSKMLDNPLVSIIINCFNGEKYLSKALDSIILQTYKNWEVIFWDNRSSDKSSEIFKKYQNSDKRMKYHLAPKHSNILYEARNYALEQANANFIAFLDVDDWWLPEKLEKQIPMFQDSEVGLVYGNCYIFFEKKNKKKIYRSNKLPIGKISNELLKDYSIASPTYVVRKKALQSLNYNFNNNYHIIGDFDLNIRIASKWKIECVQSPVAYVRLHGQNESLLKRQREINELKIWYNEMKNNPVFSNKSNLNFFFLTIAYLEIMKSVLDNEFRKSLLMIMKYPLSLNKIKLIIALLLPNFILKKIKNY